MLVWLSFQTEKAPFTAIRLNFLLCKTDLPFIDDIYFSLYVIGFSEVHCVLSSIGNRSIYSTYMKL